MAETSVNNGVNVEALLAAREALKSAPEAAKFTWRASCKWQNGTHSETKVQGFHGLGQEQKHKTEFSFAADHPGDLRVRGSRRDAGRVRARRPGELPDRRRRRGRAEPRHPAAVGRGEARRVDGHPGHPRHRQRRPQRLRRHQGHLQHRRRRVEEGDRGDRRAVAEALGGLRRHHQPDERHRRSRASEPDAGLAELGSSESGHHRTRHDRRHRRRPRRAGDEPLSHRALDRSRRARARRGGQLLAPRALGLAAAADAELAEPAARLSLRRRRSRRLHDDGRGDRVHLALRRGGRRAGAHAHHGHLGQRRPTTVTHVATEQRRAPLPQRGAGERRLQRRQRAGAPAGRAGVDRVRHAARLPQSDAAARGRRAGRRRVGHRRAAGRRDPPLGPPRDAVGRRARAAAADLSRPRRAVVDGRARASGTSATTRSTT